MQVQRVHSQTLSDFTLSWALSFGLHDRLPISDRLDVRGDAVVCDSEVLHVDNVPKKLLFLCKECWACFGNFELVCGGCLFMRITCLFAKCLHADQRLLARQLHVSVVLCRDLRCLHRRISLTRKVHWFRCVLPARILPRCHDTVRCTIARRCRTLWQPCFRQIECRLREC